jgi:hypothetical protein
MLEPTWKKSKIDRQEPARMREKMESDDPILENGGSRTSCP